MSDVQNENRSSKDDHTPTEESDQGVDRKVGKSKLISNNRHVDITEDEENELLADDDDDLDVIDCYTEDFESDMEIDFCQKEAKKDKERKCKPNVEVDQPFSKEKVRKDEKSERVYGKEFKEMPKAVGLSSEKLPEKTFANSEDDDDDADVIRIDDDISDLFMETTNAVADVAKPQILLSAKNEIEKNRILSEPLVKQMIIPEICVSDEENDKNSIGSQESLSLQIDHFVEKVSVIMEGIQEKQKANISKDSSVAKICSTLNSSGEATEGIYGCHQEDPDVLRLKLDLYQDMGEMDYEQDDKTDEDGEKNISVRIKQEPSSPLQQRPGHNQQEDIPTIVLTSTDEEAEPIMPVKTKTQNIRNRRRSLKNKSSSESLKLKMESSEDSFPIVAESTASERSIECRIRNDSEGSCEETVERVKSLRNRNVTIIPEIMDINIATKKSRASMKSIGKELKEPAKKKKKVDPTMLGYKRRKSVSRSASKSTSSFVDEDIVVISANDILVADPNSVEGRVLNIENKCNHKQEPTENDTASKCSSSDSKEELMNSLSLKESIVKELEQEVSLSDNYSKQETSFPGPTTDIALEDMLDAWIEKDSSSNDPNVVFHSISPEEKFLMDSLFADCEKQSQQLPSHGHLETLNTILDDGKPLVELSNEEPVPLSYTICNEIPQEEILNLQVDTTVDVEPIWATSKVKPPNIKIIQNYQKYPFQDKPPKRQQQVKINDSDHNKQRGRRGRKTIVAMRDSDADYRPSKRRVKKRSPIHKQAKLKSSLTKTDFSRSKKHSLKKADAIDSQEEVQSNFESTSSLCMNMPTLEEDLALTSSNESSISVVGNKNSNGSKRPLVMSPSQKTSSICLEDIAKDKGPMQVRSTGNGLKLVLSAVRKRGRPKSIKPGYTTNHPPMTYKSSVKPPESSTSKRRTRRVSRKPGNLEPYCEESTSTASKLLKQSALRQSLEEKPTKKPVQNRKRRRLNSTSTEDGETETEPELFLNASSVRSAIDGPAGNNKAVEVVKKNSRTLNTIDKMDNLQILISPLTEEKIRMINTSQNKLKTLTKASQTEICGMTWSIDLDQIDFDSEYFNKLRILLNNGANRKAICAGNDENGQKSAPVQCKRSFKDVDIPSRSTLCHIMVAESPPAQQPVRQNTCGADRTYADRLLFQRNINELEQNTSSNSEDPQARQKLEQVVNTVRSNFRIPKLSKKPSLSPQVVTSSTPHVVGPTGKDDDVFLSPLPSTSRANNQPEPNRPVADPMQRLVTNNYVNDHVEHSTGENSDQKELRQQITLQERFVPPVSQNANSHPTHLAVTRTDNELPDGGQAVEHQASKSGPSTAVEKRCSLPNRSELFNVKRTIRNDMVQPQPSASSLHGLQQSVSQPYVPEGCKYNPPQQTTLPSVPMLGSFQSTFAGVNTNSFNQGMLPGYSGMPIAPMFNGGLSGMQQPESNINNLIVMLLEQCRQQQMSQTAMQPMAGSIIHNQNTSNQLQLGPMFSQMHMPTAVQQFEPHRANEHSEVISFTFGCIDFLSNKCIKTHCRFSHVVPREDEVFQKLFIQNRDSIMTAYKFIASRDDLFNKYFPVFATVMGRNNMRHQLVSTITDCEQPKRPIQYYKYIVEGLKMSGTSPVQAVQLILEKHTKRNFHQINVLIDMILDTGDGMPAFLRTLEEFSNVRDYRFEIVSINRLIEFCNKVNLPSNELALLVSKLVLNVPAGEERLVSVGALIEFTGKVRLDPELAMNADYIVRKYGKIEMTT